MAAENGRKSVSLSERLVHEPYRFGFFQAVRLLWRVMRERGGPGGSGPCKPVGLDHSPDQEAVRFRTVPSLSFSTGAIGQVRQPAKDHGPLEMVVSFLGLMGPNGAMPYHYTRLLLRRLRDKDYSLRDLLDLFNHRLVSLFYRVWEKYRLPFAYERSRLDPFGAPTDPATHGLYCMVGLGTAGLRRRLGTDDEAVLFYGGLFTHFPRSALGLERMLQDLFQMPVRVLQLQGQWLMLGKDDRSEMPSESNPKGLNNQLGESLVVGERIYDVQSKFRLLLGPLKYDQFRDLLPNGKRLKRVHEITTLYVGPELDFDVQLILEHAEVPWSQLGDQAEEPPHLGLNTWVRCQEFKRDVDDTVFFLDKI
jgi:type VI secretion system protein ImpH